MREATAELNAVRNNAEWCAAMCRAHGRPGTFTARAWTTPRRAPMFYPDAVTLTPDATARDVLGGIDDGPGAAVKDSFARLDLPGFEVLFEARWIHRPPGRPPARPRGPAGEPVTWDVVTDAAGLRAWETSLHGGHDHGLFPAALLADDSVRILRGGIGAGPEIVCGAVLNLAAGVAGVSNVFASGCDLDTAWAGVVAAAARLFPGVPLEGYEHDEDLPPAIRQGFTAGGPLRVLHRR